MKRLIVIILAFLFLIVPLISLGEEIRRTDEYTPLTYQEAYNWLSTITPKDLLDFIIAYDYVENTTPIITPAKKLVLIEKRNIHIVEQEPMVLTIGHLTYEISTGDEIYPDIIPKRDVKPFIYVGVGESSQEYY
jgi:hypothetical protein